MAAFTRSGMLVSHGIAVASPVRVVEYSGNWQHNLVDLQIHMNTSRITVPDQSHMHYTVPPYMKVCPCVSYGC